MPYSYQVTRIEKLMIMKLVTIYILLLMLLLSCTSKKDSNIQATIDSLSIYDNHPILEISEAKHLQWVDSVLGVKDVKLIDYRNGIYEYDDTRFYWNRAFDSFLVYPSSFTHGEESDLGNGNHFVNEDSTICLNVYATYFDVFKDDLIQKWNKVIELSKKILQTIVILLKAILRVVDVFTVKLFVKKLMSVILL